MYYYLIYGFISYNKQIYQHVPACMTSKIPRRMVDRRRGMIAVGLDSYIRVDISISHFRTEQKTGSSRLFGGTKINNMPNMASRKFSYIPKVLCAA